MGSSTLLQGVLRNPLTKAAYLASYGEDPWGEVGLAIDSFCYCCRCSAGSYSTLLKVGLSCHLLRCPDEEAQERLIDTLRRIGKLHPASPSAPAERREELFIQNGNGNTNDVVLSFQEDTDAVLGTRHLLH